MKNQSPVVYTIVYSAADADNGFGAAPYDLRGTVVSMNALAESDLYWEGRVIV